VVQGIDARCGTFVVPENRAKPNGRTIGLKVVVLPVGRTYSIFLQIEQFDMRGLVCAPPRAASHPKAPQRAPDLPHIR